ncbi:MAG: hypothetical protein PHN85_11520 [Kiritimatiellae bacterium]|nr:hypothetical protein [Kiritimatiellia bacterium]
MKSFSNSSWQSRYFNVDYFSKEYLSGAKRGLIFINATRGEIGETALPSV